MSATSYTVKEVNKDGNVVVYFEYDKSTQILVDAPTDSAEDLQAFMDQYMSSYVSGKELEASSVSQSVKDLVGKKLEAKDPEEKE